MRGSRVIEDINVEKKYGVEKKKSRIFGCRYSEIIEKKTPTAEQMFEPLVDNLYVLMKTISTSRY